MSSYVGYSLTEPWGQPRVVFGVDADEAERLAAILEGHDCVGPVHADVTSRPERWHQAEDGHAPGGYAIAAAQAQQQVPAQPEREAQAAQHPLAAQPKRNAQAAQQKRDAPVDGQQQVQVPAQPERDAQAAALPQVPGKKGRDAQARPLRQAPVRAKPGRDAQVDVPVPKRPERDAQAGPRHQVPVPPVPAQPDRDAQAGAQQFAPRAGQPQAGPAQPAPAQPGLAQSAGAQPAPVGQAIAQLPAQVQFAAAPVVQASPAEPNGAGHAEPAAEDLTAEQPILPLALRQAAALAGSPAQLPADAVAYLQELAATPVNGAHLSSAVPAAPVMPAAAVPADGEAAATAPADAPAVQTGIVPLRPRSAPQAELEVSHEPVSLAGSPGAYPPWRGMAGGEQPEPAPAAGPDPQGEDQIARARLMPVSKLNRTRRQPAEASEAGSWQQRAPKPKSTDTAG
ncbi:MAG TPA: hypothetical protein VEL03_20800 [Streptosporangiaceae bacterium]|nr:hypothetical protein [Streptosporangiaceae bacterium]